MHRLTRRFALALFLMAFVGSLPLAAAEVFTAAHVAKLRRVTQAAISPHGSRIAYVLEVPRRPFKDDDGPAWRELHVVDKEGDSRRFVTGHVRVSDVAWTPDGKAISFLAKRGQDKHISLYLIPVDGGEARRLLSHKDDLTAYSWSPDGKQVAFLAKEAVPEEKEKLKKKGFSQEIYEEEARFVRVWIAAPEKEDAQPRQLKLEGSASELHWSPVDSRLAVALAPTPRIDDHYMHRKLHVVDADSGKVLARFDNPGKLGQVAWSPDGKHLALISGLDLHDPMQGRLMVAPSAGGPLRNILPDYPGHVSALAWQDADTLMFLGDEGVWTTFNEIRRDGTGRKTILARHLPKLTPPDIFTDFSLSRDGQAGAFLGENPQHPSEVFFMQHGDNFPRRLTDSNPWLAELELARQEVVTYEARDGLRLEGILIRPFNEENGRRYPLILKVHGGPEAHYPNGWLTAYSLPGQLAAARGFAVFYPNYRGSTGRGVEFSKLSQGDFAGKEFDDLVDGVDHLIETGLVDAERVGITGGSYGGYASAWGATFYTDRFAAGVMAVGISDNVSKWGTTDISDEIFLVHQRRRLWEEWQFFLERSPIFHAGQSKTPLLILHGKEDPRVHPGQSMEIYRHLKVRTDTPVRLVFYPGEGHGNRRAASRFDFTLRMMRWFEHYLKGPGGPAPPYELDYQEALKEEGAE